MSRFYSYLNTAAQLIKDYRGEEPFAPFLKKYFAQHKKYGSKDRKQIAHLCYCYFRLGKAMPFMELPERIVLGLFLCSREPDELLTALRPDWGEWTGTSAEEKITLSGFLFDIGDVFPWPEEMSGNISYVSFCHSFFIQPHLFLRLRPGQELLVKEKLTQAGIDFSVCEEDCLSLPATAKADQVVALNKEAVVQDYSSQQTGKILLPVIDKNKKDISVWDCCAASGGKSLLVIDLLRGRALLTVSDIRESILINLRKRFAEAGIRTYRSFTADLSTGVLPVPAASFDLVVADVPCTGSGTWSRTPEQLFFFDEKEILRYSMLQKKIVQQAWQAVKPGGYLLYITCSVFKKENEEVVAFISETNETELVDMQVLKGYDKYADTMFAALLRKRL